jgi:hypothetical protein
MEVATRYRDDQGPANAGLSREHVSQLTIEPPLFTNMLQTNKVKDHL